MNGALTIDTLDDANIEIRREVGSMFDPTAPNWKPYAVTATSQARSTKATPSYAQ